MASDLLSFPEEEELEFEEAYGRPNHSKVV